MNTLEGIKTKNPFCSQIKADSNGKLPTRLQILKVGNWRTPYHGDFMITSEDLEDYVRNFEAGIGLADGGSAGAPIDFSHENEKLAAAWIKSLDTDGITLFANVKWSKAGADAIANDEYKFFSPEFCPKGRGGWLDPEDYEHVVDNVLTGGGLTNIPLFKSLGAIKASANGKHEARMNIVYINANEIKGDQNMTLEEVRKKEAADLTEAEKQLLVDNQAELDEAEQVKFGFKSEITTAIETAIENKTEEAVVEPTATEVADVETAAIAASIKAGSMVAVSKEAFETMQSQLQANAKQLDDMRRKEVEAEVLTHVARGAIKADAAKKWTDKIMADASIKEMLTDLSGNTILAGELGSSAKSGDATSAKDEMMTAINDAIKASNGALSYSDAALKVSKENSELANRYAAELSQR